MSEKEIEEMLRRFTRFHNFGQVDHATAMIPQIVRGLMEMIEAKGNTTVVQSPKTPRQTGEKIMSVTLDTEDVQVIRKKDPDASNN